MMPLAGGRIIKYSLLPLHLCLLLLYAAGPGTKARIFNYAKIANRHQMSAIQALKRNIKQHNEDDDDGYMGTQCFTIISHTSERYIIIILLKFNLWHIFPTICCT